MKPLHLIGVKNPEEKALELTDIFYRSMSLLEFNSVAYKTAVKCAINCVDEILSMRDLSLLLSPYNADSYRTFYTKVKDELSKMKGCDKCNNEGWIYRDAITSEKINCECKKTKTS